MNTLTLSRATCTTTSPTAVCTCPTCAVKRRVVQTTLSAAPHIRIVIWHARNGTPRLKDG
eukprot:scaffold156339_cov32-Tisochrysis_lutea.AAC.1